MCQQHSVLHSGDCTAECHKCVNSTVCCILVTAQRSVTNVSTAQCAAYWSLHSGVSQMCQKHSVLHTGDCTAECHKCDNSTVCCILVTAQRSVTNVSTAQCAVVTNVSTAQCA